MPPATMPEPAFGLLRREFGDAWGYHGATLQEIVQ